MERNRRLADAFDVEIVNPDDLNALAHPQFSDALKNFARYCAVLDCDYLPSLVYSLSSTGEFLFIVNKKCDSL